MNRSASRYSPFLAAMIAVGCIHVSAVPAQTIRFAKPVQVNAGTAANPLYEPHLAVSPTNPNHLLAAAIVHGGLSATYADRMKARRCAAFLSVDGGATWTRHDFSTTGCFDPWIAMTPDGRALVTTIGEHASLPEQGQGGLVAFRSTDGGRNWEESPVGLGRSFDHTTMVVDQNAGPRQGWIYISSNRPTRVGDGVARNAVQIIRSRDGGRTFDDPTYLTPNNLKMFAEMPVVMPDGTLIESFVDAAQMVDTGGTRRVDVLFERRRAWVVRSKDGGYSFSVPMFVTDACGPPPGYRLSAFAADLSGGLFAGRLYFLCRGKGRGPIMLTYSRDGGETWTAARALHSPRADSGIERIPAVTVNNRGVVLVSWIDAIGATRGRGCEQGVYVTASTNGGQSFSAPQVVVSSPACATWGDYNGLIARLTAVSDYSGRKWEIVAFGPPRSMSRTHEVYLARLA